jgi:hypothetical protein
MRKSIRLLELSASKIFKCALDKVYKTNPHGCLTLKAARKFFVGDGVDVIFDRVLNRRDYKRIKELEYKPRFVLQLSYEYQ